MKKHMSYSWKGVLISFVVLVMLGSAAQAFEAEPELQDITFSATVREPSGATGTIAFTVALEEMPAASAVLPNYSTIALEPSALPEPSTLVLAGLGMLGLVVLRRTFYTKR